MSYMSIPWSFFHSSIVHCFPSFNARHEDLSSIEKPSSFGEAGNIGYILHDQGLSLYIPHPSGVTKGQFLFRSSSILSTTKGIPSSPNKATVYLFRNSPEDTSSDSLILRTS